MNLKSILLVALSALVLPVAASATTILVDFGPTLTSDTGWNNVTIATTTLSLVDSAGDATNVILTITSPFNTTTAGNTAGTTTPSGDVVDYPSTAIGDSLFGNTADFSGQSNRTPIITLSGLDANTVYKLSYFASRTGSGTRQTIYTLSNGIDANDVKMLNVLGNNSSIASSAFMAPSASDTLTLALTPGTTDNIQAFTYLGFLEITTQAIPEPSTFAAFAGLAVFGLVAMRRRQVRHSAA